MPQEIKRCMKRRRLQCERNGGNNFFQIFTEQIILRFFFIDKNTWQTNNQSQFRMFRLIYIYLPLTSYETVKIRHPWIAMNDNMMVARYPPPVIASLDAAVVHIKDARAKPQMRYHIAYFWRTIGKLEQIDINIIQIIAINTNCTRVVNYMYVW